MTTAPTPPPAPVIVAVPTLPAIKFVEARWYRRGKRRSPALWVVLHATHGAEHARAAEDGARELQLIPPKSQGGRLRSAHAFIDSDSAVQCVPWECEAYHAGAHGNQYGEGLELCGRADQTRAQWLDAQSLAMLRIAAHVVRWRCDAIGVPLIFRPAHELKAMIPGVTTHAEITKAFPGDTSHTDPGPGFPLVELLDAARALQSGA